MESRALTVPIGPVEYPRVHYADFVSNDFAAILSGVETIHASTRPVPKAKAP